MQRSYFRQLYVAAIFAVMSGLASADESKEQAIAKDRKQIDGTWRIVSLDINGKKVLEEDAKKLTVVNHSDGSWSLHSEGKEISKGNSTIDPMKKPKSIDFIPTEGGGKGNRYLGIYELGEKTRKMCFAPPGQQRPIAFASPPDSEHIFATFERESKKAAAEDSSDAAATPVQKK